MRNRFRVRTWLGVLLVFAMVAAACGSDDDGGDTTAAPQTTQATTQAPDALEGAVVTILGPETGPEGEGFVEGFAPLLERTGIETRVMTAIRMEELAEPYIRRRAQRHLEKGRVVLFAGGTGNPYFSTDTAAVLRALEIEADLLIKATNVDGVYSADPKLDPNAEFLPEVSFQDAMVRGLRVMDANAFGLCKENGLPIVVMNVNQDGAVARVLQGERVGTLVR